MILSRNIHLFYHMKQVYLNLYIFENIFEAIIKIYMKRKSYRRRRDQSDSGSSSSYSQQSSKKPQDLYSQLKSSLVHNEKYSYQIIRNISKTYKQDVGILRITTGATFSFNQKDIEQFFSKFGKIQNVIIKQPTSKLLIDQSKNKQSQSIAYVIYVDYFSAILALKIVNSVSQKQRIVKVQLCCKSPISAQDKQTSQPMLFNFKVENMILHIEKEHQFGSIMNQFKYVGTIGLDLTDRNFKIRERILGVQGCNFVRIYYLCDKIFKFENQGEQFKQDDLQLKLIVNKSNDSDREVLVVSHCLQKYNHAIRYLHQLMEQIVEEYKNSREKSTQIIAKDIHIKRWEKFIYEPQLKFVT